MLGRIFSSHLQRFYEQIIRLIVIFVFFLTMLANSQPAVTSQPSVTVMARPTQSINMKFFVSATLTRQPMASTLKNSQVSKQQQNQHQHYNPSDGIKQNIANTNITTARDSSIPRYDLQQNNDSHKILDKHATRHEFNVKNSFFEKSFNLSQVQEMPTKNIAKIIASKTTTVNQKVPTTVFPRDKHQSLFPIFPRRNTVPRKVMISNKQVQIALNQNITPKHYQNDKVLPKYKKKYYNGWDRNTSETIPPKRSVTTRADKYYANSSPWMLSLPDSSAARKLSTMAGLSDCLSKSASFSFYDIFSRNFKLDKFFMTNPPSTSSTLASSTLTSFTLASTTVSPTILSSTSSHLLIDSSLAPKSKYKWDFDTSANMPSRNMQNTPAFNYENTPTQSLSFTRQHNSSDLTNNFLLLDANMFLTSSNIQPYDNKEQQKLNNNKMGTVTVWQLYNHCSAGFLQAFLSVANARGRVQDHCLINFLVHSMRDGSIALEQAQTHRFLCFNRRKRLTVRRTLNNEDAKCRFREHMTTSGYTLLESAHTKGLYLGFNRHGRFEEPSKFEDRKFQQCFHYSKLEVEYREDSRDCNKTDILQSRNYLRWDHQSMLYELARNSLLKRIEI